MGFQQGFRINTNTASLDTYRNYSASQAGMERNIERLSSGLRINKAADDSAGLSISNRMDNQVRGLQQANRNVQQGNNLLQTAEGAMNEIGNMLGRMRELAVQSASDGVNSDDRASIDLEFEQLKSEITRIASATEYNNTTLINGDRDKAATYTDTDGNSGNVLVHNGSTNNNIHVASTAKNGTYGIVDSGNEVKLTLNGSSPEVSQTLSVSGGAQELQFDELGITIKLEVGYAANDLNGDTIGVTAGSQITIQVGSNNSNTGEDQIAFNLGSLTDSGLGISTSDLSDLGNSQQAINQLDAAIAKINDERSNVGSLQNRLEFTSSNLMNSIQNNSASMSTIRDADFAVEAADLARNQILTQSGSAMLAQANSLSQNVLSLIR